MSPRWLARVTLALLAAWVLGASALRAQVVCGPSDTTVAIRQGGGLAYIVAGGDSVRHASGVARGWTTIDRATAVASWLAAFHDDVEVRQTIRIRIRGCLPVVPDTVRVVDTVLVPSSPVDGRDSTVPPPAIDSLPPEVPEQPPQDTVAPDPGTHSARGVITCQPEALCTGDARASLGDSVVWMGETGTGTAARLVDFQGLQWGPRTVASPRTRTWWIVAWSGARADTARVVWTVPVAANTNYPAAPLDSPPAPTGFTWLLIDPRLPGGLITYPGPDSTWTPRQECTTARVVAGLTHWEPGDTLGWSNRFGSLGQTLAACRGVIP